MFWIAIGVAFMLSALTSLFYEDFGFGLFIGFLGVLSFCFGCGFFNNPDLFISEFVNCIVWLFQPLS